MKYQQPYGISDPNAAYINGNPSTGTMGSIPPAASIEHPQREVVAAISAAGITPSEADLGQLTKALKYIDVINVFKAGVNTGSASQWSMTCPTLPVMPPPVKTAVWFKPNFASVAGGTLFSLNGAAFAPVVNGDLTPIAVGDIVPTAWVLMFFDGTNWQIVAGSTRQTGAIPILTGPFDLYVNVTTGNDTTYDGSSATVVSATVGPFKTIQKALNVMAAHNTNGYTVTIHVANGTYPENVHLPQITGSGLCVVAGDVAAPGNVHIAPAVNTAIDCVGASSGIYRLQGLYMTVPSAAVNDAGAGLAVGSSGNTVHVYNCEFGACFTRHMFAAIGGQIIVLGKSFSPGSTLRVSGSTNRHMEVAGAGALIRLECVALNVTTAITVSGQWALASRLGNIDSTDTSDVPTPYNGITGFANVTGQKYSVAGNGMIYVANQGVNYYPGTIAGALATGGQYY